MRTKAQSINHLVKRLTDLVAKDKEWREEFSDEPYNGTEGIHYMQMLDFYEEDIRNLLREINPAMAQRFNNGSPNGDASTDEVDVEDILASLDERQAEPRYFYHP